MNQSQRCLLLFIEVILLSSGYLTLLQQCRRAGLRCIFTSHFHFSPHIDQNSKFGCKIFDFQTYLSSADNHDSPEIYFPCPWNEIILISSDKELTLYSIGEFSSCFSVFPSAGVVQTLKENEATFGIRQLRPLSCPNSLLNGAVCYVGSLVNQDTRH